MKIFLISIIIDNNYTTFEYNQEERSYTGRPEISKSSNMILHQYK